jgi:hypothetical protein
MVLPIAAFPQQSYKRNVDFPSCLKFIRDQAVQLGQSPINIVETNDLRIVRFLARDSSILVKCNRLDETLTMQLSQSKGR